MTLICIIVFSLITPAFASDTEYVSSDTFLNWASGSNEIARAIANHIPLVGTCPDSADSRHHANSYVIDGALGHYLCNCIYCGNPFRATESDLKQAYDDYVNDLPYTGYTSSGEYSIPLSAVHFSVSGSTSSSPYSKSCYSDSSLCGTTSKASYSVANVFFDCDNNKLLVYPISGQSTCSFSNCVVYFSAVAPVSGFYAFPSSGLSATAKINYSGSTYTGSTYWDGSTVYYEAGAKISKSFSFSSTTITGDSNSGRSIQSVNVTAFPANCTISPIGGNSSTNTNYNINTRPSSITGNYGIVGDNGSITTVTNNSSIVNETNNTYYNPVTGKTSNISSWNYDYSDRSYSLEIDNSDNSNVTSSTVTYGDEYITITETTINEGDTITNTYYVYYIIEGSGTGGDQSGEDPPVVTPPGGSSDNPPGGDPSGDNSGDDGDESIWSKIGSLLGSFFSGLISLISKFAAKILDALTALLDMIKDGFFSIVETVLSFFDEIPQLFDGYLAFLCAVFPFLSPDIMLILTFGIAASVFIGIIKAVRRR